MGGERRSYPEPGSPEFDEIRDKLEQEGFEGDEEGGATVIIGAGLTQEQRKAQIERAKKGERTVDLRTYLETHNSKILGDVNDLKYDGKGKGIISGFLGGERGDMKYLASEFTKMPIGSFFLFGPYHPKEDNNIMELVFKGDDNKLRSLSIDVTQIREFVDEHGHIISKRDIQDRLTDLGYIHHEESRATSMILQMIREKNAERDEKTRVANFRSK